MPDLFISPKALRGLGLLVAGACLWAALGTTSLSGGETEWVAPARAAKKPNPVAVTPDSLAKGKVIYEKSCLSCHGDSGMGNGPKAKDLDVKPKALAVVMKGQSDGAIYWKTMEGRKPMASYEKELTPTDVWNVINFMRTLNPKGK